MTETEQLVQRLERLERSHRRLKGFALIALLLVTALATIYSTQPVPEKVTAHEFEVVDDAGKARIELRMESGIAVVAVHDAERKGGAFMGIDAYGSPYVSLSNFGAKSAARIGVDSGTPYITLSDQQGFEMDLGSTGKVNSKTGATEQTSAASIVMFGNDKEHHVIWQAP